MIISLSQFKICNLLPWLNLNNQQCHLQNQLLQKKYEVKTCIEFIINNKSLLIVSNFPIVKSLVRDFGCFLAEALEEVDFLVEWCCDIAKELSDKSRY